MVGCGSLPSRIAWNTSRPDISRKFMRSLKHVVGAQQQRGGNHQPEGLRHFQVDQQLEPGRLLDGKIAAGVEPATITSTLSRASSLASSGSRVASPSAYRVSIAR